LFLQTLELDLHLPAELEVKGAQGFVKEQHLGPVDNRPRHGNPLPLAAGKFVGPSAFIAGKLHQGESFVYGFFYFRLCQPLEPEAVTDVLFYVHVGEERVVLKYHIYAAPVWFQAADILSVDKNTAGVGAFKPRDDPEGGSFAAARRTEESDEFTAVNGKIKAPEDFNGTKAFFYSLKA
jgi:hypothetical protein